MDTRSLSIRKSPVHSKKTNPAQLLESEFAALVTLLTDRTQRVFEVQKSWLEMVTQYNSEALEIWTKQFWFISVPATVLFGGVRPTIESLTEMPKVVMNVVVWQSAVVAEVTGFRRFRTRRTIAVDSFERGMDVLIDTPFRELLKSGSIEKRPAAKAA